MEAERGAKLKQAQEGTKVEENFERGVLNLLGRLCNKKVASVQSATFRNLIPMQALNLPH
jgi:hypothetical protein